MFTGLISEIGRIEAVSQTKEGKKLLIDARNTARGLKKGESVAINGACQTAVSKIGTKFSVLAIPETLKRTNFTEFQSGSQVNLELPLRFGDRMGGHFVTGHVDAKVRLLEIVKRKGSVAWWVELPKPFTPLVVEKGSVALDGVSLTVAGLKPGRFKVALIPYTLSATTFGERKVGDFLNVEFDFLGKYVRQFGRGGRHSPPRKKRGKNEV